MLNSKFFVCLLCTSVILLEAIEAVARNDSYYLSRWVDKSKDFLTLSPKLKKEIEEAAKDKVVLETVAENSLEVVERKKEAEKSKKKEVEESKRDKDDSDDRVLFNRPSPTARASFKSKPQLTRRPKDPNLFRTPPSIDRNDVGFSDNYRDDLMTTASKMSPIRNSRLPDNKMKSFVKLKTVHETVSSNGWRTNEVKRQEGTRHPRFFGWKKVLPYFSLVTIRPSPCVTGTGENGTCYSATQCSALQGSGASGTCAGGFGTCCVFQLTCGQTASQNCTYFVNTNYPQPLNGDSSCSLSINKINNNICQLRLDFIEFTMDGPESTNHQCLTDTFKVLGTSSTPTICGVNTGSHMYVNLGPGVTSPSVLMAITSGANVDRKWKIKITQIPCGVSYAAPSNCLQYYTGVQGTVSSYNYNSAAGLQLSNQDYSICIRNELNFCGIQYTACTDSTNTGEPQSFIVSGSAANRRGALVGATNCPNDWIIIPCLSDSALTPTSNCQDRLCGDYFNILNGANANVQLYSFVTPFTIFYHTNELEGAQTPSEVDNRGFCLNYSQQPCS